MVYRKLQLFFVMNLLSFRPGYCCS